MAKTTSQSQGAFSFFDELDKTDQVPQPKKHVLRPPAQIEAVEEEKPGFDNVEEATEAVKPEDDLVKDIEITDDAAPGIELEPHMEEEEITDFPGASLDEEEIIEENNVQDQDAAGEISQEKRSSRGRKSVKEHSLAAEMIEMPGDDVLYSKQYYSMGEVTAMFRENHSLIRYWESEFDILKPKKNGKGDRFFRPVDVKNLYLIYDLLRRRKFTIEGARDYLKNNRKADEKFAAVQSLEKIKAFFLELKASL